MKEDYLWDKKGNDSEIEDLENALKAFRQKDMSPPELPTKTLVFDKDFVQTRKPRRLFQFAFAGFACLALMIISFGVIQIMRVDYQNLAQVNSNESLEKTESEKMEKENPIVSETEVISEKVYEEIEKPIQPKITNTKFTPKPKIKKQFVKTKKPIKTKAIQENTVAKTFVKPAKKDEETVKLTEEEQYAYDQLMKALAITSSKLKIVKDKVQGLDETAISKGIR
jgi:hypothetical protein